MNALSKFAFATLLLAITIPASAASIFAPGDPIVGGQAAADLSTFEEGAEGFVIPGNNWPGGEAPIHAIDGVGQKYLNFGQQNTGIIVTPSGGQSVLDAIQVWTANDSPERDPASYQIWGSNDPSVHASVAGGSIPLSSFTLVNKGPLNLPDSGPSASRNDGGDAELGKFYTLTTFDNVDAYCTYAIVFDDIKDPATANSMQMSEVQVHGEFNGNACAVPEPAANMLLGFALLAIPFVRRRR